METRPKNLPLIIGGGCLFVLILACVGFLTVGAGAAVLARVSSPNAGSEAVKNVQVAQEAAPSSGSAQEAQLLALRGLVEMQDAGGEWLPVVGEQTLLAGQRVRTGALSSAQISFFDGSRAELGPGTEISLDEIDARQKGARQIVLTQWSGESSHAVIPTQAAGSRYEVQTPNATGAAKGTHFSVRIGPDQSSHFLVDEGAVAVTALEVTVVVEAGQVSLVNPDQPPSEPVFHVSGEGVVSMMGDSWVIGGQTFTTHSGTVIIGSPQVGDTVLVQGRLLSENERLADWIVLLRLSPANRFSLTGTVESIGELNWMISGQSVDIFETTVIAPEIAVGDRVRVDGVVLEDGLLQADNIRRLDQSPGLPFELTGIIQDVGDTLWTISGVAIAVNAETEITAEAVGGAIVTVVGWIQEDGNWLAVEIRPTDVATGKFEFTGTVETIDPWRVAKIGFETRDWTEIDAGLEVGMRVHVEGQIEAGGAWVANEIKRVEDPAEAHIVFIGTVFSLDPWVVNGIPLIVDGTAVIEGDIAIGTLVRVEVVLLPGGAWQVVRIAPLPGLVWFPGCMNLTGTVESIDGDQLLLAGWPVLTLSGDVLVDGSLTPGSVITFQVCFTEARTLQIISIVVVYQTDDVIIIVPGEEDDGDEDWSEGGKVTVCHKPDKKGGHSITISRSALPAHLGHGDKLGPCR